MSNENLSILFGVPLWSFLINNDLDVNNKLITAINEERIIDRGVNLSNNGGWQSHGKLHFKPEFQVLVDIINSYLIQVGREYGFASASSRLKVTSMWANVNPKECSNALHSHQSPTGMPNPLVLSGCYYLKVPENSGQFVIEDFSRPMRYLQLPFQQANLINSYTLKIHPKEGNLLFFPAWMEHRVEENMSDESRISIAFNVAIMTNPMKK